MLLAATLVFYGLFLLFSFICFIGIICLVCYFLELLSRFKKDEAWAQCKSLIKTCRFLFLMPLITLVLALICHYHLMH